MLMFCFGDIAPLLFESVSLLVLLWKKVRKSGIFVKNLVLIHCLYLINIVQEKQTISDSLKKIPNFFETFRNKVLLADFSLINQREFFPKLWTSKKELKVNLLSFYSILDLLPNFF